jgi:hypothetical protein
MGPGRRLWNVPSAEFRLLGPIPPHKVVFRLHAFAIGVLLQSVDLLRLSQFIYGANNHMVLPPWQPDFPNMLFVPRQLGYGIRQWDVPNAGLQVRGVVA